MHAITKKGITSERFAIVPLADHSSAHHRQHACVSYAYRTRDVNTYNKINSRNGSLIDKGIAAVSRRMAP